LEQAISEAGGQISRIFLNHRPETGSKTAERGSIPSSPASQSMLFMANAKGHNFSRVSGQLADAIFKQSIEIGILAVEKDPFRPPVSGR
jgi:hypothetical protein